MYSSFSVDPAVFDPANAPADAKEINAAIVKRLAGWDNFGRPLPEIRALRAAGQGPFPLAPKSARAETIAIDGPHGPILLRIIAPETPRGVYFHIHGGGWVLGAADQQDPRLDRLADKAGMACVSVEYGLAPEHPYPKGADDCEAAALWLAGEALSRFGTDKLVIGGESAGAHLSATILLRMRDKHGIMPFRAANLHAGCYDLALTPSVRRWGEEKLVLNTRDIQRFARHYLVAGGDVADPDVSPLHADLRGMPKAFFSVGSRDPLLDDTLFMAQRWAAAGNAGELAVYPGGCHVFIGFPGSNTDACLARLDAFMIAACA